MKTERVWTERLLFLLVIAITLIFLFPFIWMLLASFKTQAQILSNQSIFVFQPTGENYATVFRDYNYTRFIFNSLLVAFLSTLFGLVLGLPASYAIAKYKQNGLAFSILIARVIPGISFMIPWYIIFSKIGLVDTYLSLILAHMLVGLPFIIWVMISFYENLPHELEESARVDGCTIQGAFFRILLPLSVPGIVTASILAFIFSWNNFMFALVLSGEKTKTLPIAVYSFLSYSNINWGALMAAAVVITLPILVITLILQRYVVSGITVGAVKG
ncbi:sugar ABC transporter permease [Gordoniibacillus kamchatkensis]|uniref:Sugar ABC transporter permease n=1 Tax=Gordoniibacillus kamchatkensis TaxID=1590651 RepID=A0ABR5AHL5_9BACL|nr:carbohydrate ABC transporter permease [Paenibacillus sp. VKM B-2647]KIL40430.1 sugar ABC transporter permease [Paenibacillus sp. VKM B-2647]